MLAIYVTLLSWAGCTFTHTGEEAKLVSGQEWKKGRASDISLEMIDGRLVADPRGLLASRWHRTRLEVGRRPAHLHGQGRSGVAGRTTGPGAVQLLRP